MTEPDQHRTTPDPEPEGTGKQFARDGRDAADVDDVEDAVDGTPPGSGKQFAEPEQSRPRNDPDEADPPA